MHVSKALFIRFQICIIKNDKLRRSLSFIFAFLVKFRHIIFQKCKLFYRQLLYELIIAELLLISSSKGQKQRSRDLFKHVLQHI